MVGRAKPPPHPMEDAAMPSSAMMHARWVKNFLDRHLLPGNSGNKAANAGAAKGHCGSLFFPAANCVVVWTVMADCALELPGVTDAGEKLMVPPGRPVAVRATAFVKLPLVDDTLTL